MPGADAAGRAREPGASRAQPRGRRGGGEREPEPEPSSSQCWRGAAGAQPEPGRSRDGRGRGETVGECRGLVSPARYSSGAGWSLLWGGCRRAEGGPGGGAGGGGGGRECVHEFGRASGAEARARNPQAWLWRDATVSRLGAPRSPGCGRKGTSPLCSLEEKILGATVLLGCLPLRAHLFPRDSGERRWVRGFPPVSPAWRGARGMGTGSPSPVCPSAVAAGQK